MLRRLLNAIAYRAKLLATLPIRRRLGRQVRQLDDAGFALISNNCLAGQLYEMAGRRKMSPTAGLYFLGDSYPRFLEDLAGGDTAAWARIEAGRLGIHDSQHCPVLCLGEGSEIVFLHYRDPTLAARKWNDRFPRLKGREKVVIASPRDGIDEPMLERSARQYRHFYLAGPAPAPPADEFVLDRGCLSRLSQFLEGVLASRSAAPHR